MDLKRAKCLQTKNVHGNALRGRCLGEFCFASISEVAPPVLAGPKGKNCHCNLHLYFSEDPFVTYVKEVLNDDKLGSKRSNSRR